MGTEAPPRRRRLIFHMRRHFILLAVALAIALVLPFPGPHIDSYIPIAAILFRRDALDADPGFFILIGVLLAVYTAVAFAVLLLVARRRRA
ncbi:MAG TPA: hypothetical protein VFO89_12975 [Thermoanaerobaculia bacterium]|nr:hypothetical protein [Thermoanaerobaculia bacterium]